MKKERMRTFVESIQNTGLLLEEPAQYKPNNPHHTKEREGKGTPSIKPWTIVDEWHITSKFCNKFRLCLLWRIKDAYKI